jgi:hypothetical protein
MKYLPLKERVKSSENLPNGEIRRKSPVLHKIISRNYYTNLSLVYYVAQKWVNYRDTGVSKNILPAFLPFRLWVYTGRSVIITFEFEANVATDKPTTPVPLPTSRKREQRRY